MTYVDGFVIPIPKKNLAAYRKMATLGGKVWRDHGALDYKECVADDLSPAMPGEKLPPTFPKLCRLKPGETIVFSYIVFRNRKHRDRVNANVMKDPRMQPMVDQPMPFDLKRFAYAGFNVLVDGTRSKARR
jgi:uncharacterized protein YbaA (DUF1428 family)